MNSGLKTLAASLAVGAALSLGLGGAIAAETPKKGGVLKFVVPAEPPSFDGHRETTFALVHPIAPFYSLLVKQNPQNSMDPTDIICDLCTEMPKPTDGGKTYTFKLRKGVTFEDGAPLTAADVKATYDKIIFPPADISSARKAYFVMVESVETPDDETVVFKLKYPSSAFIPALAMPFNFIYDDAKLAQDMHWYEKNILGSGPFQKAERQAGAFIKGTANPNYYEKGKPYLDGFEAIFAKKESLRVQAIRGDRAAIEFRGFPPQSRDDLVKALGKDITVQESDWNCVLLITPNHRKKPFDDVRVRRALTLAVDRWGGSQYLSKIAIVKTVGGIVFPGHPLAANKEELQQLAGYWPDLAKSRAEAKRLLKEAGIPEGFKFVLNNRAVDQPYKIVGTWLIDQWKQIGLAVEQQVQPTGPFYDTLRKKQDFDVSIDFNCQSVVNPLLDVSKFISEDTSGSQYGGYTNREVDELFNAMNQTDDQAAQREKMRRMEKIVLDEEALGFITMWWYRIIPHRSYVKGWNVSPSHYLNQQLADVWLDQ
ncbi:peptide ABC transporter substrate-binding protein [Thalassobaculum fulvum]|uniref:Peptide ABC transporter substrate-binding protein n=1 Tax=Thalassobaculum fulvum TaxID=1633335 RepID=A0A918XTL1_9PROT|nr:ABC transporter substrate-binding protein [Thalassobaculum fulvum]GHD54973.1 peptide ABC transporter substrate-binding protein [Thalassobaculum fulvum]